jgi:hypothetical protein
VLEVTDSNGNTQTVTSTNAFTMGDFHDPSAGDFGSLEYNSVAGDFVEIDVSLNDVDEAFIMIGGDRRSSLDSYKAPLDILHVSQSGSFLVNTRLIGTDPEGNDVYIGSGVTSYAQELGPDAEPSGVFSDLRFEDENFEVIASTLTEFRQEAGIGRQIRPWQPGRYSLVLGSRDSIVLREDGVPDPRYPLDRANLVLSEPELGNVTGYRVPEGNANERRYEPNTEDLEEITQEDLGAILGDAVETDELTVGDRFLMEVEATGIWGTFVAATRPSAVDGTSADLITPAEFSNFLETAVGLDFSAEHVNPADNQATVDFDPLGANVSDVSFFTDPTLGSDVTELDKFYMLVDTRAPGAVDRPLEGGERFRLNFSYLGNKFTQYNFPEAIYGDLADPWVSEPPDQFPYFTTNQSTQSRDVSFSVEDRVFSFGRLDGQGRPIVTTSSSATIVGSTTYPPDTRPFEIVIDKRFEPESVDKQSVDITEDGRFSAQFDLSGLNVTDKVDMELWIQEELVAERELALFDAESDVSDFQVTDLTTDAFIAEGEPVADITASVRNIGDSIGTKTVEVLVDGEVRQQKGLTLMVGQTGVVNFDETAAELGPGTHPIEVRTQDGSKSQLLIIEASEPYFSIEQFDVGAPIVDGEPAPELSTEIRNSGTVGGSTKISFRIGNETFAKRPLGLTQAESREFVVTDDFPDLAPGTHNVSVQTPNETATKQLEISNSVLGISNVSVDSPIRTTAGLNASLTLINTGNVASNDTVSLTLGNETIESWRVELANGSEETRTVEGATLDLEPGTYTMTATTPDDEITTELVIEEPPEDEEATEEDESDDEDSGDDGGDENGPGGIFAMGVRPRSAIGGTAIVGLVYVMGHWI